MAIECSAVSFTGYIVDTYCLLEMLIMRHHLGEERPLCHSHHGGLLLIIRLQERGEEAALEDETDSGR